MKNHPKCENCICNYCCILPPEDCTTREVREKQMLLVLEEGENMFNEGTSKGGGTE